MSPPGADDPATGDDASSRDESASATDWSPERVTGSDGDAGADADVGGDDVRVTEDDRPTGFEDESPVAQLDESESALGPEGETDDGFGYREFAVDMLSSVVAVALVGFFLFAVSGVWPPLVAVESGSMNPHMKKGDLVFVMEEHRFPGENAYEDTGVVTARRAGDDYTKFEQPGDVIIYEPNGDSGDTPIIHRAMFWVNASENWYDEANRGDVGGADSCKELSHCPAGHGGFITLGDNNEVYDQAQGLEPVKPEWVIGTAEFRIPALGWVRLRTGSTAVVGSATAVGNATAVAG